MRRIKRAQARLRLAKAGERNLFSMDRNDFVYMSKRTDTLIFYVFVDETKRERNAFCMPLH